MAIEYLGFGFLITSSDISFSTLILAFFRSFLKRVINVGRAGCFVDTNFLLCRGTFGSVNFICFM